MANGEELRRARRAYLARLLARVEGRLVELLERAEDGGHQGELLAAVVGLEGLGGQHGGQTADTTAD